MKVETNLKLSSVTLAGVTLNGCVTRLSQDILNSLVTY